MHEAWRRLVLPAVLLVSTGCAAVHRADVGKNLMADRHFTRRDDGVSETYRIGCPDVIELHVPPRPEFSGTYTVNAHGKIDLGDYGKLRVDGRTLGEVASVVGAETGVSPADVKARVVEFRSQHLLLFGQV